MQTTFTPITDILYKVTCNSQVDWQELLHQAEKIDWAIQTPADGNLRHAVCSPKTKIENLELANFVEYFASDNFKNTILDLLFANPQFLLIHNYPNRNEFDRLTTLGSNLIRTPPNFVDHPWHPESSQQVAFGMIYLIDGDDPRQSTYFNTLIGPDGIQRYGEKDIQRIETGFGLGWIVIRCDRSLHRGCNDTSNYRYSLKFSLDFCKW